ncbi:MAG: hypothetical protein ACLPWD_00765 [Methanobacterium sp.]
MLQANKDKIEKKVTSFIKKNKDIYSIVSTSKDYILISKRKKLTVYTVIDNSVFQPYEKNIDMIFSILIGLKFCNSNPKELKDLIDTGFTFNIIDSKSNIEYILSEF